MEECVEVETVTCHCCGLAEECTQGYIAGVRERHKGRWVCGLCAAAIEYGRAEEVSEDEAIGRQKMFYREFWSTPPRSTSSPNHHHSGEDLLISAVRQLLRRTLDSPRKSGGRSAGGAFDPRLERSKSCFAAVGGAEEEEEETGLP